MDNEDMTSRTKRRIIVLNRSSSSSSFVIIFHPIPALTTRGITEAKIKKIPRVSNKNVIIVSTVTKGELYVKFYPWHLSQKCALRPLITSLFTIPGHCFVLQGFPVSR